MRGRKRERDLWRRNDVVWSLSPHVLRWFVISLEYRIIFNNMRKYRTRYSISFRLEIVWRKITNVCMYIFYIRICYIYIEYSKIIWIIHNTNETRDKRWTIIFACRVNNFVECATSDSPGKYRWKYTISRCEVQPSVWCSINKHTTVKMRENLVRIFDSIITHA